MLDFCTLSTSRRSQISSIHHTEQLAVCVKFVEHHNVIDNIYIKYNTLINL